MKHPFSAETGAEYTSRLLDSRIHNVSISLPGFPEHYAVEVCADDADMSRVVVLGARACSGNIVDYAIVSFPTTDTPLDPAYIHVGEVDPEDGTIWT